MGPGTHMEIDSGHSSLTGHEPTSFAALSLNPATPTGQRENGETYAGNAIGNDRQNDVFCHHSGTPHPSHTCIHPYHSEYSETNLPLLLFRLDPPNQDNSASIGLLLENGVSVMSHDNRAIRNFTFLPRYISSQAPAWLFEYWMRTDSRLTYRDIKARMVGPDVPTDNALNMRRERDARTPLGLSCWTARRGGITRAEVDRAEGLTADQVAFNTTMTVEYSSATDGRKVPVCLRSKSIKSSQSQCFPLSTFLNDGRLHTPSERLTAAIELLYELQDAAMSTGVEHWKALPDDKLPVAWIMRGKAKDKTTDHGAKEKKSNTKMAVSTSSRSNRRSAVLTPNGDTQPGETSESPSMNTTADTTTPFTSLNNNRLMDIHYKARLMLSSLSRFDPSMQPIPDQSPMSQENRVRGTTVNPRLINYDPMEVDSRERRTGYDNDTGIAYLHPFNGVRTFCIRNNHVHRLNNNTAEALKRECTFVGFRQRAITTHLSFGSYATQDFLGGYGIY